MGELIEILDLEMETPKPYGWFHVLSMGITALTTFIMCRMIKKPSEKTVRKILLITALTVIILEIYKQINFTFSFDGNTITKDYQWYAFPFQFCSTPMYVGLLAALIKNPKVHNSLCAYLSTFSLFAGTAVMLYPTSVFISTIGINIQTMVCHGSMISIGIFLLYSGYVKIEHKTIIRAVPIFSTMLLIAISLNELARISGILESETFNMFFISPYCEPSLPVFSLLQPMLPFPVEIIVYIIGFSIAAYAMLLLAMGIKTITRKTSALTWK